MFICEFSAQKYVSLMQGPGDWARAVAELGVRGMFAAVLVVVFCGRDGRA